MGIKKNQNKTTPTRMLCKGEKYELFEISCQSFPKNASYGMPRNDGIN